MKTKRQIGNYLVIQSNKTLAHLLACRFVPYGNRLNKSLSSLLWSSSIGVLAECCKSVANDDEKETKKQLD